MHAASLDTDDDLEQIVVGVAHDFGNALAVVTNYLSLVSRRIDDPGTAELIEQASAAARRAARLTRQLHDIGECGTLEPEPLSVNDLAREVSPLLAEALCERCTLQLELTDAPDAMANRTGLEMALRHLVQNACDAMPDGGLVTVGTRTLDGTASTKGVELRVTDTGVGMPPEVADRALEPRFSTRPKGQAGGLGLTIVDRVAHRLGGEVQIESAVGSGTTVRLILTRAGGDG
jgi:signal transduction histidine kinase